MGGRDWNGEENRGDGKGSCTEDIATESSARRVVYVSSRPRYFSRRVSMCEECSCAVASVVMAAVAAVDIVLVVKGWWWLMLEMCDSDSDSDKCATLPKGEQGRLRCATTRQVEGVGGWIIGGFIPFFFSSFKLILLSLLKDYIHSSKQMMWELCFSYIFVPA